VSAYLARLRYFVDDAVDEWRHSPGVNVLATATLAAVLFAGGLLLLAMGNVQQRLDGWMRQVKVDIYLRDDIGADARAALVRRLTARSGIARVDYVTKAEALQRFRATFGDLGRLPEQLDENPLPASLEAFLQSSAEAARVAAEIAAELAGTAGVEEVRYDRDWIDRLEGFVRVSRRIAAAAGIAALAIVVFVMAAVLRLAVHARQEEIEIMLLVGASRAFVRGPFLVSGLAQGSVATAAALVLVEIARRATLASAGGQPGGLIDVVAGSPLEAGAVATLFSAGIVVGLAGSFFAVRRAA
jgi:cell division transport system permease protein